MTRIDIKAILRHPKLRAELLPAAVDFICRVERIRQSPVRTTTTTPDGR
jgi:hypothetical protein